MSVIKELTSQATIDTTTAKFRILTTPDANKDVIHRNCNSLLGTELKAVQPLWEMAGQLPIKLKK